MKTLYKINLILVIINVILGLTIYLGLLFMIITGVCQVVMYLIYLSKWKDISKELKTPFIKYGIITVITLSVFSYALYDESDFLFTLPMITSGLLAFYFLYISKKQRDFYVSSLQATKNICA